MRGETRVSLALHPDLAPYKVAVLPLLKKRPEIVELCHRIMADLQRDMMAVYDDTAAIGKLYRRQDEIGTPWCVTVDVDSLEDGAVTVRDRDSMTQERVPVEGVKRLILDRLEAARERRPLSRSARATAREQLREPFGDGRDYHPSATTSPRRHGGWPWTSESSSSERSEAIMTPSPCLPACSSRGWTRRPA